MNDLSRAMNELNLTKDALTLLSYSDELLKIRPPVALMQTKEGLLALKAATEKIFEVCSQLGTFRPESDPQKAPDTLRPESL
jgi:hypothetical protein